MDVMKRILLITLLLCIVSPLLAQSDVEQLSKRYEAGERDPKFVKEYVEVLKQKKMVSKIETVADIYLMQCPLNERYIGFDLEVFNMGINLYNQISYRELIDNWNSCVNDANIGSIEKKIKNIYSAGLWRSTFEKKNLSEDFIKMMQNDIQKLESQMCELYKLLLDLKLATEKCDYTNLNKHVERLLKSYDQKVYQGWNEMAVVSASLTKVVEDGDIESSKELLKILKPYRINNKPKYFINSISQSLEGKIMMSE